MDVRVGLWRKLSAEELMLLKCGVGDSWESLGLEGDPTNPFWRRSALGFLWKEWCWSWNSSTLATSCEELTHWKRLWCWEGLGAGGEGENRGWDDWMASLNRWTWVWVNSGSWWWTGRPDVLLFMGSQRVGHDWVTELNWTLQQGKVLIILKVCHAHDDGLRKGSFTPCSSLCAGPVLPQAHLRSFHLSDKPRTQLIWSSPSLKRWKLMGPLDWEFEPKVEGITEVKKKSEGALREKRKRDWQRTGGTLDAHQRRTEL